MSTLAEIEAALPKLSPEELSKLQESIRKMEETKNSRPRKSWRDIKPVDLGAMLKPFTPDDDILGEMLDAKRS